MKFKPIDAARECGVNANTIRNWCQEYHEFLSAGTQPEGASRSLTERDVDILKHIAQLRKDGIKRPQIMLRLRELHFGEIEHPQTELPETLPTHQETLQKSETTSLLLLNTVLQRVEAVEKRQRDNIVVFSAGFIAASLFFLLMLLLFWATRH